MSSIKNRRSKRLIQKQSNKKSSSSNSNKNRQHTRQSKRRRLSNKKSNINRSSSNRSSSNNNECLGWIPKGTIFKPSKSTPDEFGYIIIKYIKKDKIYLCGNIASHHKDMYGTPFPCKFVEEIIDAEWQPKKTRNAIIKLKKKLNINKT